MQIYNVVVEIAVDFSCGFMAKIFIRQLVCTVQLLSWDPLTHDAELEIANLLSAFHVAKLYNCHTPSFRVTAILNQSKHFFSGGFKGKGSLVKSVWLEW